MFNHDIDRNEFLEHSGLKPLENPRWKNGALHASALECSSQNPKRYQYANGLTRQCLAFVQPHTAIALWGNQNMLWAWWDRYDSVERLHKSKQVLACHSHIRFWTVSAYDFFLRRRWDTFFRERKATKSNVLGSILLVPFFLWLVVRYSFASCQNVATQHHPAGLSMLDLWSGAVHDLQSE